jgi:tetratricopeptide (TPR) repeat protein
MYREIACHVFLFSNNPVTSPVKKIRWIGIHKYLKYFFSLVLFLVSVNMTPLFGDFRVRLWEEDLVLPTYKVGDPDPSPIFYNGKIYQGAQGRVYPYAMLDILTDNRNEKTYRAIYLENKYLKLSVLPEIGGRLFSALDKTNSYDFIYRQHVIKPALVGMLGAWISGGVEWNIPHHHRASTYMPVDYTLRENPDGSKTVWFGELELRHRMKWVIGITAYPDKSYFKATVKLFNRTPLAHSILYWANLSVHGNKDYQVIFPPGTQFAVDHSKVEFTEWPVSYSVYRGVDFSKGKDLSWWKNHPRQTSCFAWNYEDDFVAGYDHGKDAGICHVANHHIATGKKFFEWGNGPVGRMWDKILTETDGPYLEIMTGAWSDNQPDYSWCQPYEVKIVDQYWYPIRRIKGVKNANLEAAVNLETTNEGKVFLGFNTTSLQQDARVVLMSKGSVLFQEAVSISPEKPYTKELSLPDGVREEDLEVSLLTTDNEELISYRPVKLEDIPKPEPAKPPRDPEDIETIEELYLTGLRLEQFYNPALEPYPYYEEALRRDPGDYRVNTALGILYCKRYMFEQAEKVLSRAVERASWNFTMPKDGEAFYYLGVALKAQGKYDQARDYLFKATWSHAFHSAAYYELAELASLDGRLDDALTYVQRSLSTNALNTAAVNLQASLLRRLGRYDEALKAASIVLALNPLEFKAKYEKALLKEATGQENEAQEARNSLIKEMRENVQSYLELAVGYSNCGFWDEALDILQQYAGNEEKGSCVHPMVYYWLGYLYEKKGESGKASDYYRLGGQVPPDRCFPFRAESIEVLRTAAERNRSDSRCHYYIGNLLYDHQPAMAIKEWELSRSLDDTFWTVHRNLGFAYSHFENDMEKSIASYEKALACNQEEPRLFYELDLAYEAGGVSPQKRLELLQKNHTTLLKRYDALTREILLLVQLGHYDKAIDMMSGYHFHKWEGVGVIHNIYVDAHLLRGRQKFSARNYNAALEDFKKALEYPENLEVGKPYRDQGSLRVHFFIGTAYEALGEKVKAIEHFEKAVSERATPSEILYYQGVACRRSGKNQEAEIIFDSLIDYGQERLKSGGESSVFAKFGEKRSRKILQAEAHYLTGLGYLGKGRKEDARLELQKALELNINHLGAGTHLAGI